MDLARAIEELEKFYGFYDAPAGMGVSARAQLQDAVNAATFAEVAESFWAERALRRSAAGDIAAAFMQSPHVVHLFEPGEIELKRALLEASTGRRAFIDRELLESCQGAGDPLLTLEAAAVMLSQEPGAISTDARERLSGLILDSGVVAQNLDDDGEHLLLEAASHLEAGAAASRDLLDAILRSQPCHVGAKALDCLIDRLAIEDATSVLQDCLGSHDRSMVEVAIRAATRMKIVELVPQILEKAYWDGETAVQMAALKALRLIPHDLDSTCQVVVRLLEHREPLAAEAARVIASLCWSEGLEAMRAYARRVETTTFASARIVASDWKNENLWWYAFAIFLAVMLLLGAFMHWTAGLAAVLVLIAPTALVWIAHAKSPDRVLKPDGYDEMKEYFVKVGSASDLPLTRRRWWEYLLGTRKWA